MSQSWNTRTQLSDEMAAVTYPKAAELLSFFEQAEEFCRRVLASSTKLTDRDATRAAVEDLTIQIFRTAVGAARMAIDGYADVAAGLARSTWEIQLRIQRIRSDGEVAALADRFVAIRREILLRQAALKTSADREEDLRVLSTWAAGRADILIRAANLGADEKKLNELGDLSVQKRATIEGLTEEYEIWFRGLSQMHHGARGFLTYTVLAEDLGADESLLKPICHDVEIMIALVLEHLFRTLAHAAQIIDDQRLAAQIDGKHYLLSKAIAKACVNTAA